MLEQSPRLGDCWQSRFRGGSEHCSASCAHSNPAHGCSLMMVSTALRVSQSPVLDLRTWGWLAEQSQVRWQAHCHTASSCGVTFPLLAAHLSPCLCRPGNGWQSKVRAVASTLSQRRRRASRQVYTRSTQVALLVAVE